MKCFLCDGALEDAKLYPSIAAAARQFQRDAEELDRFGQRHEASLHFGGDLETLAEYPDRVLSLGPRGGLRIERT